MAQKRHICQGRRQVRHQTGNRQGDAAALTAPGHCHALCIHRRMASGSFYSPNRIREHPPIIIVFGVEHSPGHKTGILGIGPFWLRVWCVASLPGAALPAGIHHKMSISQIGKQQPVNGFAASTAIANVLHHARQWPRPLFGQQEPSFNCLALVTVISHIKNIHPLQTRLNRIKAGA